MAVIVPKLLIMNQHLGRQYRQNPTVSRVQPAIIVDERPWRS